MDLYSDRKKGIKEPHIDRVDSDFWDAILSIFIEFRNNQAFSKVFPLLDENTQGIKGFNQKSFEKRIKFIIPNLLPLNYGTSIEIKSNEIFDFIEFCYSNIYDIEEKVKYEEQVDVSEFKFRHYVYTFYISGEETQDNFREKINNLFQKKNIQFQLNSEGKIENTMKIELTKKAESFENKAKANSSSFNIIKTKINSISINNIRCFNEIKINFDKKNSVILGVNATGKSTILQLLAFGLKGIENPPNEWKEIITKGENKASFRIELEINDKLEIFDFEIGKNDEIKIPEKLKKLKENILIFAYGAGRSSKKHNIDIDIIKQTADVSTLIGINQFVSLHQLKFLENKAYFNSSKSIINKVFNDYEENINKIELESFKYDDVNEKYNFFFLSSNNSNLLPLEAMSDGFRTTFLWIIDFLYRLNRKKIDISETHTKPEDIYAIVLLDEIDLHLHPKWQRAIMPRLIDIFKNVQFIVSTHSPFIVQSLESKVILLNENSVVDKYEDISKWRIDQILSSELFNISSLRSQNVETNISRKQELLDKEKLSEEEESEKKELDKKLDELPTANNQVDIDAMKLINDFAKTLKAEKND